MAHAVVEQVRAAGVVGAGGAGFPTHVKLDARVDTYICNAAECEPLLCKDAELMRLNAERVVHGLRLAMEATGAGRGVIAIKHKNKRAIEALKRHTGSDVEFYFYDNFYPAGDEFIIVYDVTGRLIPPAGIPLKVGCAVNNVETLINVSHASEGRPVTHSTLSVAGAVHEPLSVTVPLGVTASEVIELAGGPTVGDYAILDGGAMMGRLVEPNQPVTKTSGGYIVLPADHRLVLRRRRSEETDVAIARSACDQCSYCTEFCPRYLLGYAIEPHKVMRSVGFAGEAELGWAEQGLQCCECNLCSLYACPEDLPVMEMCRRSKTMYRQVDPRRAPLPNELGAHPMRDARRVPIPRLIQRLDLTRWDVFAPMTDQTLRPYSVRLELSQHIGAPAVPTVREGDRVRTGQVVAAIPEGKLGANVHASIDGSVAFVDDDSIYIRGEA